MLQLRCLYIRDKGINVEPLLPLAELPYLRLMYCSCLSFEELLRLDELINEPRLRENFRKGHLAGNAISKEQVKKLELWEPMYFPGLDGMPEKPQDCWYPPVWLSEAWARQPEPPISKEPRDWFPRPREKTE